MHIAHSVPNFVAMATGVDRGKCNWQHSMAYPRKPPYRRKNLLRKQSYSQFCPKFRCHGNGCRSGKMQLAAFDGPSPKTPKFRCHGNQMKGKGTGKENGKEKG